MLTKKLHQAYQETGKLADFLEKRDWNNSTELTRILECANKEIEKTANKAVADVLAKLENRYVREAQLWADNKMTKASGERITISAAEQKKARTELKKIKRTIARLQEML